MPWDFFVRALSVNGSFIEVLPWGWCTPWTEDSRRWSRTPDGNREGLRSNLKPNSSSNIDYKLSIILCKIPRNEHKLLNYKKKSITFICKNKFLFFSPALRDICLMCVPGLQEQTGRPSATRHSAFGPHGSGLHGSTGSGLITNAETRPIHLQDQYFTLMNNWSPGSLLSLFQL